MLFHKAVGNRKRKLARAVNALKQILLTVAGYLAAAQFTWAQTWIQTSAPFVGWNSVATSADGRIIFVAKAGYGLWISTNWGSAWSLTAAPNANWSTVACSADGLKVAATATVNPLHPLSPLYTSTNEGLTWISNTVPQFASMGWVTCSTDGSRLTAPDGTSTSGITTLCSSTNFGVNWVTNEFSFGRWSRAACSADGRIVYIGSTNSLYVSTNYGRSWMVVSVPGHTLSAIATSADGIKLVGTDGSAILVSTNSGFIWTKTSAPTNAPLSTPWTSVAMSADGSHMVSVAGNSAYSMTGPIYTSSDFGLTWVSNNAPLEAWGAVASSSDGLKLYAIDGNGGNPSAPVGVWTSQSTSVPWLNLSLTNGATISWMIPSTNFVLQQTPDLSIGTWGDVTNVPVLNFSTLQNEIVLPVTSAASFFRLTMP